MGLALGSAAVCRRRGFIEWFHNTTNKPAPVNQVAFETEVEAAFDNWEAVGALTGAPTVPALTIGSGTTSANPIALWMASTQWGG